MNRQNRDGHGTEEFQTNSDKKRSERTKTKYRTLRVAYGTPTDGENHPKTRGKKPVDNNDERSTKSAPNKQGSNPNKNAAKRAHTAHGSTKNGVKPSTTQKQGKTQHNTAVGGKEKTPRAYYKK